MYVIAFPSGSVAFTLNLNELYVLVFIVNTSIVGGLFTTTLLDFSHTFPALSLTQTNTVPVEFVAETCPLVHGDPVLVFQSFESDAGAASVCVTAYAPIPLPPVSSASTVTVALLLFAVTFVIVGFALSMFYC